MVFSGNGTKAQIPHGLTSNPSYRLVKMLIKKVSDPFSSSQGPKPDSKVKSCSFTVSEYNLRKEDGKF